MSCVTVKVTLVTLEFIPVLVMAQTPLALVLQLAVPVAPFVHLAETVTLAAGSSDNLCTRIVTVAFHLKPDFTEVRSRSPTWMELTCVAVAVAEGVSVGGT